MFKRLVVATALALAACSGSGEGSRGAGGVVVSGQGAVNGTALGTDFTFTPIQVFATAEPDAAGNQQITLMLCEKACDRLGLIIAPDSRAVSLALSSPPGSLSGGAQFNLGQGANGFATLRVAGEPAQDARGARIDPGLNGQVNVQPFTGGAGDTLTGTFSLGLTSGGSVTGSFTVPVVVVSPTSASVR